MNDRDLVKSFQAGDEFAFVSLYNRHKSSVYAFCAKMLQDRDAANDVLQETFIRVYENRTRLTNAASFRTWLFTIARNQCLNYIRRHRRTVTSAFEGNHEPVHTDTPLSQLEKSERRETVDRFLSALKEEYREVLILREYQNLSYEEICIVTQASLSSVKSRLFKARRKLASFLIPVLEPNTEATKQAARSTHV